MRLRSVLFFSVLEVQSVIGDIVNVPGCLCLLREFVKFYNVICTRG